MRRRQRGGSEGKGQRGRGQRRIGAGVLVGALCWAVPASAAQPAAADQLDEQAAIATTGPAEKEDPLPPTQSPSDVSGELKTVQPETGALVDWGIEELLPRSWIDWRQEMKDRYGFEFGFAYTALFQQASGGPGRRNAAGGDVDLFGTWRLVGTADDNPGKLVWAADNRHALFTELTPAELGPEIGTLFDTSDGFNERDFALRQLFWEQHLFNEKLVLSAGKVDPGNYYNGSRASNDNLLALNKSLSANPARFFPEEGIGANAKLFPQDDFFLSFGVHDAGATGTETGLNTVGNGNFFYAGEFGFTPKLNGELEGFYRFAAWYNDPVEYTGKDSGWGIGVSIGQFITPTAAIAVRYGWQSADDVEVEQVFSAQYLAYVGGSRPKDVWGIGAGWGRPSNGDLDDEFVGETFYRLQLTRNMQVTPDVQVIVNPSNAPDDDVLAVFGIRLRFAY